MVGDVVYFRKVGRSSYTFCVVDEKLVCWVDSGDGRASAYPVSGVPSAIITGSGCPGHGGLQRLLANSYFMVQRGVLVAHARGQGGWGDDVHAGSDLDNNDQGKICGTRDWLLEILDVDCIKLWDNASVGSAEVAVSVAYGSKRVDYDVFTNPVYGEQSWHFNDNRAARGQEYGDSRIGHALDQFVLAQEKLCDSKLGREAVLTWFKALGKGLHPLQDCFAHSDEYVTAYSFNPTASAAEEPAGLMGGEEAVVAYKYSHASIRGWYADDVYAMDTCGLPYNDLRTLCLERRGFGWDIGIPQLREQDGEQVAVEATKISPVPRDRHEGTAALPYNGRYALTRLATWIYFSAFMFCINKGAKIYGSEKIIEEVAAWLSSSNSAGLYCLRGFVEKFSKIAEVKRFFEGITVKGKSLYTIFTSSNGDAGLQGRKVDVVQQVGPLVCTVLELPEAKFYEAMHDVSHDLVGTIPEDYLSSVIKIKFTKVSNGEKDRWLGVNGIWCVAVEEEKDAVELAVVKVGHGYYLLIAIRETDKNGMYKVVQQVGPQGYVGIAPYNGDSIAWRLFYTPTSDDERLFTCLTRYFNYSDDCYDGDFVLTYDQKNNYPYSYVSLASVGQGSRNTGIVSFKKIKDRDVAEYNAICDVYLKWGDRFLDFNCRLVTDKKAAARVVLIKMGINVFRICIGHPDYSTLHGSYNCLAPAQLNLFNPFSWWNTYPAVFISVPWHAAYPWRIVFVDGDMKICSGDSRFYDYELAVDGDTVCLKPESKCRTTQKFVFVRSDERVLGADDFAKKMGAASGPSPSVGLRTRKGPDL